MCIISIGTIIAKWYYYVIYYDHFQNKFISFHFRSKIYYARRRDDELDLSRL